MTQGVSSTPSITHDRFEAYRRFYHRMMGSILKWSVTDLVLRERRGVYRPQEIARAVPDNSGLGTNDVWWFLDSLGLLGPIPSRAFHGTKGLRVELPDMLDWLAANGGIPHVPPRQSDFHVEPADPDDVILADAGAEAAKRARRALYMLDHVAGVLAANSGNTDIREANEGGRSIRALLIGYTSTHCETLVDPDVDWEIESSASDRETGTLREVTISGYIDAAQMQITEEAELRNTLEQLLEFLSILVTYDPPDLETDEPGPLTPLHVPRHRDRTPGEELTAETHHSGYQRITSPMEISEGLRSHLSQVRPVSDLDGSPVKFAPTQGVNEGEDTLPSISFSHTVRVRR
jgi:hypothetical protein